MYPEAKFIHIVRDGHDVTKSFKDKGWNGKWLCKNLIEWKESISQYNSYKTSTFADRIYEVKYENLVLNTEATIRSICVYLGMNFEADMLSWEYQARKKIPERELHIHKKIFRRPREEDTYKWKNDLSLIDIFIIESYLHKELKNTGYDVKFRKGLWYPFFFFVRSWCDFSLFGARAIRSLKKYLVFLARSIRL